MLPDCLYLGLGGNLPETEAALSQAVRQLSLRWTPRALSSVFLTEPQDFPDQPPFLNLVGAWELPDSGSMNDLLQAIQAIETGLGRVRKGAIFKGPRIIDLDILLAGPLIVNTPLLTIPHPRMHQRRFVLEPLIEIAPGLEIPGIAVSLLSLLSASSGQAIYSKRPLKYTDLSI